MMKLILVDPNKKIEPDPELTKLLRELAMHEIFLEFHNAEWIFNLVLAFPDIFMTVAG